MFEECPPPLHFRRIKWKREKGKRSIGIKRNGKKG